MAPCPSCESSMVGDPKPRAVCDLEPKGSGWEGGLGEAGRASRNRPATRDCGQSPSSEPVRRAWRARVTGTSDPTAQRTESTGKRECPRRPRHHRGGCGHQSRGGTGRCPVRSLRRDGRGCSGVDFVWAEQEGGTEGWGGLVTSGSRAWTAAGMGRGAWQILAAYLYRPEARVFRKEEQTRSLPACPLLRGQGPRRVT